MGILLGSRQMNSKRVSPDILIAPLVLAIPAGQEFFEESLPIYPFLIFLVAIHDQRAAVISRVYTTQE
jgi:hypothetical protein